MMRYTAAEDQPICRRREIQCIKPLLVCKITVKAQSAKTLCQEFGT